MEGFSRLCGVYGKAKHLSSSRATNTDHRHRLADCDVGRPALKTPLPGGGKPNPACAFVHAEGDHQRPGDNAAVGWKRRDAGQFRVADFGDLLWNNEDDLMCPNNPIGTVDLYLVTHHGLDQSNRRRWCTAWSRGSR